MRSTHWLVAAVVGVAVWGLVEVAHAQTATANFTWSLPSPIDKATNTKIDYGTGSGCNPTSGCSAWTAAPGSPIAASATQFSQPSLPLQTLACWRFIRTGGGSADGDPVIVCGTPDKNGKLQNMILIFN